MRNVKISQKGKILTIEIDVEAEGSPSKSGKTMVVATTAGNKSVAGGKLGLNFYRERNVGDPSAF